MLREEEEGRRYRQVVFGSWAEVGAADTGHTEAAEEGVAGSIVAGEAVVGDSRRAAGEKAGLEDSRRRMVAVGNNCPGIEAAAGRIGQSCSPGIPTCRGCRVLKLEEKCD